MPACFACVPARPPGLGLPLWFFWIDPIGKPTHPSSELFSKSGQPCCWLSFVSIFMWQRGARTLPPLRLGSASSWWVRRTRPKQILENLKKGEDFAALAKQKSTDATADDGGYMGKVDPATLRPELREALKGVRPGANYRRHQGRRRVRHRESSAAVGVPEIKNASPGAKSADGRHRHHPLPAQCRWQERS